MADDACVQCHKALELERIRRKRLDPAYREAERVAVKARMRRLRAARRAGAEVHA